MLTTHQSPAQTKNEQRITSLEIARLSGKPHNDLMKSIRLQEVGWSKVTEGKFSLSEYTDPTGRKLPMYQFNQAESLYIASKFNDQVRAKLVVRWMELEHENKALKKRLRLREDEQELLSLISKWLLPGDQVIIAKELDVRRKTVSNVKCGYSRSKRILAALVDRALYNKRCGRQLVIGYDEDLVNTSIEKLR